MEWDFSVHGVWWCIRTEVESYGQRHYYIRWFCGGSYVRTLVSTYPSSFYHISRACYCHKWSSTERDWTCVLSVKYAYPIAPSSIPLEPLFEEGSFPPTSYNVVKDDKYCGEIRVSLTFSPEVKSPRICAPYTVISEVQMEQWNLLLCCTLEIGILWPRSSGGELRWMEAVLIWLSVVLNLPPKHELGISCIGFLG